MITRRIREDEKERVTELFSVCFGSRMNASEIGDNEVYGSFEDDDSYMFSCVFNNSLSITFDGEEYKMGGIGGVATLPTHRRRGGIAAIFRKMLRDSYDEGITFSYLYPFSSAYYSKFGYGDGITAKRHRLRLSLLPTTVSDGCSKLVDAKNAAEAMEDIKSIEKEIAKENNGMVLMPGTYDFAKEPSPYEKQEFIYVYYSKDGKPLSYMVFKKTWEEGGAVINCSRFYSVNKAGILGLLALAKTFAADYAFISLELPDYINLPALLTEKSLGAVQTKEHYLGMVRVINVKKALEGAAYSGSGSFVLKIDDEFIRENNTVFKVEYKNGRAVSVTAEASETPDLELTVNLFSTLLFGVAAPEDYDLPSLGVFKKKKCFINAFF